MPAKSKAQQMMMAIAKHHPEKLYKRNKGVLKMSKKQLGEFSAAPVSRRLEDYTRPKKGLPRKKGKLVGKALKRKRGH